MNQKKCPKCGELNPPEAVMCWACYTPLTGAAAAVAATGAGGVGRPTAIAAAEEEAKKPAATPAQMGIIGVALVVGLLYGGYAMFGGAKPAASEVFIPQGQNTDEGVGTTNLPPATGPASPVPPPPTGGGGSPDGVGPREQAFSIVAAPSPNYPRGTMAILSSDPAMNQGKARDLARKAVRSLAQNQWKPLSVYIFNDAEAANQFKEYQSQRGNKPLTKEDYPGLTQVWSRTFAYYQYTNGSEVMLYPSRNASGWWGRRT